MRVEMRAFEAIVEELDRVEFNNYLLELKGKKIDEESGRVERFDYEKIGNFHEDTIEIYLKELSKIDALDSDEIEKLVEKIKEGDDFSKELLIEGSLKKVAKIALSYSKSGTSTIELIQEGLIGVIKAIDYYDLNLEIKFSEYMEFWVKYEMIKSNKSVVNELKSPIITYLKHQKVELFKRLNNKVVEFEEKEIQKQLKMDLEEYENLQKINEYGFLINEEDEEDMKNYDTIEEIDDELSRVNKQMMVSNLTNKFTIENIKMLDLYYGLSGKRKYYEELGKEFDITPDVAKNVIDKLMVKLKYNGKKEWIDEN